AAKRRKLSEAAQEADDLKKRLEIIQDEDDDKVPVVDYQVVVIDNKPKYKIIRADDTHQFYISFTTLLKNFDREDLKTLWRIVKDRFSTKKPTNFSDEFLLLTLKTMFGELDEQDAIWRNQKNVHGLALVKRWKLLTSCGVHVIILSTVQLFLLVERRYPLSRFTLEQLVNVARLQAKVKAIQDAAAVAHANVVFSLVNLPLLRAPTEGYAEAIVVPSILDEQFELKHNLINMMTSDQSFGLEKDNPHDHIRWFNKITSTIKYKDVPNSAIKLILFPFSLAEAARRWLKKEPSRSILTWEYLANQDSLNSSAGGNLLERRTQDVLTIIEYKSKVRNSRNKSIVSQVKSSDANTSSSEIAKLTHAVNQQTSDMTTAMTAILKQFQATSPPAFVKAIEEIYGNSGYRPLGVANQIRPSGFAQPDVQNNQNRFSQPQGYNRAHNFNQDSSYQAPMQQNQIVRLELEKIKKMNEINMKAMQTQINNVKNELRNEMKILIQALMSNQTNELKNMMASFFQMNTSSTSGSGPLPSNTIANPKGELKAITTQSGIILDGPSVPIHPPFISLEEDECEDETLTDQDLAEYTIKVPPPLYHKMLKALLSNKEKLLELENIPLNENCSAVILKKLPEKLRDPRKFLILCGFSKLKCKALADLGASINLMSLSVWKKLGLHDLISTPMTLELANRAICKPVRIARDVFVPVGKFTFPADFVIFNYKSDPRVPLILGRPFLRTARALIDKMLKALLSNKEKLLELENTPLNENFLAVILKKLPEKLGDPGKFLILVPFILGRPFLRTARALIDVYGEKMILRDGDERLTLNMRHDTSSYSNQPQKESINMINIYDDSSEDFLKDLFATNHLSGNPTFSSHSD
nr:reverse transcriptase domain-containing protein [Tanacetum cinerariifolium]